ncbi:hypothetical protein EX30DRAFT_175139 [Ascodesmis nigricans]|uniref:Uncharacterized protein n=1 Tax=Ascodesmis nigricans TaxID=341454 RepID=A0A4S2MLB2_9PEZI|nr:hypothetical protein EX30DRAFT_175139 [Ascodesmis nigricans]
MKNRKLFFRMLGTAAALPSTANGVFFIIHTISTINHGGPFTAITTVSSITSILSTAHLFIFTVFPTITTSARIRLLSTIPAFLSSTLCASSLIWMTVSRHHLPPTIANLPATTLLILTFISLLLSIFLQFLFWALLFFWPPPNRHTTKGLPYTSTSPPHPLRPFLKEIKIPPSTLPRNKSVVITVRDPLRGSIISQNIHTPKHAPPFRNPPFRSSTISEQFRVSMPSVQNSISLPSPRRESTPGPNHQVSNSVASSIARRSCEAEVLDISALMTPRSLGLASVLPPTPLLPRALSISATPKPFPLPQVNTTASSIAPPDFNHFDSWEPSSPSTAEVQRNVEAETKAAEAEERLLRSIGMGMAAKGKKRPGDLNLMRQRSGMRDGRPCSPELPKTPKTPGRRGSTQAVQVRAVPIGRKASLAAGM